MKKDLMEIVPNWQQVKLTKVGYSIQYLQTITRLEEYIKQKIEKAGTK